MKLNQAQSLSNLMFEIRGELKKIVLNNSTWKTPCDTKKIARCCPEEEQELGREQVLDDIRALIETLEEGKWGK